jgi:putative Ca2+/H+ antiporter (TMEM165/GDT1 family)
LNYKEYLLFNKNILIGFVCAFIAGAITSQLIAPRFTYALNSLIPLITEDVVFYTVFGIKFYMDNRKENDSIKQKQQSTSLHNTRFGNTKWVIIKLVSTMSVSVAKIEYNIVKPYVHYGC